MFKKKQVTLFTGTAHHSRDAATGFAAVAHGQPAGVWKTDAVILKLIGHTSLSTALVKTILQLFLCGMLFVSLKLLAFLFNIFRLYEG